MLKKLIKHEWQDTWMVGTICSIVIVVLTIIGMILLSSDIWQRSASRGGSAEAYTMLLYITYFMMLFFGALGFVLVIKYFFFYRYYKNLFTDHGYLMNTLPVKSTDLINAKLIVAVIWQLISYLLIVVAAFGLFFAAVDGFESFSAAYRALLDDADVWGELAKMLPGIIAGIIICILTPFCTTLIMYAAVGVGQLSKKHKFLVAVLLLLGFNIAMQFASQMLTLPFNLMISDLPMSEDRASAATNIFSVVWLIIVAAATVGLYFANKYFLEKRLNLE
jgi:hypothetical protein